MPRYVIPLTTPASTAVEIETDLTDPEAILALALETFEPPALCGHCTDHVNDLDGEWVAVRNAAGRPEIRKIGTARHTPKDGAA